MHLKLKVKYYNPHGNKCTVFNTSHLKIPPPTYFEANFPPFWWGGGRGQLNTFWWGGQLNTFWWGDQLNTFWWGGQLNTFWWGVNSIHFGWGVNSIHFVGGVNSIHFGGGSTQYILVGVNSIHFGGGVNSIHFGGGSTQYISSIPYLKKSLRFMRFDVQRTLTHIVYQITIIGVIKGISELIILTKV